jgi:uncharacterized protein (TIGR01777 family)
MRVFVTGGTGLVGGRLVEHLLARGDQPVVLSRRPEVARQRWDGRGEIVAGDPSQGGDWLKALGGCDAVVNLAGENLFARRWSAAFKEQLRSSRVESTTHIARALSERPRRADGSPKVWVSGSAIGIYGPHGDETLDESAPAGDDFLARLCVDWENATQPAADAGARVVRLRTGIVFDGAGGPLMLMLLPFRLFVGGPVGSGRQYMSWIHNQDMSELILFALDNRAASGPMNATAPNPVSNRDFGHVAGRVLRRPSLLPTPAFAMRLGVGEAANVMTTGQRVVPRRALELGYAFRFPELEPALRDLLGRPAVSG